MESVISTLVFLKQPELDALRSQRRWESELPGMRFSWVQDAAAALAEVASAECMITLGAHLGRDAAAIFDRAEALEWIQVIGTGVDNVVDQPGLRPQVVVTNVRGIHGRQMSEAALTAMLSLARDTPRLFRNQAQRRWERFPARLLAGKTVGVFGLGAIAETLAPLCGAFGMRVVGISSSGRLIRGLDQAYGRHELAQVVRDLDYLVLLTPYSPETHEIIDTSILAAMKPTACLVNLARGGVVDEVALLQALRTGVIAGAALDVFATEPLASDHPFWTMPNVIVTPHLGGFHESYMHEVSEIVKDNLRRYGEGGLPALINRVPRAQLSGKPPKCPQSSSA